MEVPAVTTPPGHRREHENGEVRSPSTTNNNDGAEDEAVNGKLVVDLGESSKSVSIKSSESSSLSVLIGDFFENAATNNNKDAASAKLVIDPDECDNASPQLVSIKSSESSNASVLIGDFFEDAEGQGSTEETEGPESKDAVYQPKDLVGIIIPVAVCMIFVIVMTITITPPGVNIRKPFMALTPFHSPDASASTLAWQTAANVGIVTSVIVVMTFFVVLLYLCYCYKVLLVFLALPVFAVNYFFTWIYLNKVFLAWNIPCDLITMGVSVYNFGSIGILSIFGRVPKKIRQGYLVYLCGVMAIVYIQYMPTWTVWLFLGVLSIWDLIAVLTPCGPLRILVDAVLKREHDFIPGMIYTTMVVAMADKTAAGKPEKRRLRLGLGDFVFYSLLIGKAVESSLTSSAEVVDWNTTLACFVAILSGMIVTIIMLIVCEKPLPALPISIALGLVFYFSTSYVISPICTMLSGAQLFL